MAKYIDIEIKPDGSSVVTPVGFQGTECTLATREYEEALGVTVKDTELPEMRRTAKVERRVHRGRGESH